MPNRDARLWRYLDFPKYVSLLETSKLWFPRVDLLDDEFEGSVPTPVADELTETDLAQGEEVALFRRNTRGYLRMLNRPFTFVNCWHCRDYESDAMWKLYGHDQGIAIVTTLSRMRQAMRSARQRLYVGHVRYIDYETEDTLIDGWIGPFTCKRKAFEHEREVRALLNTKPKKKLTVGEILDLGKEQPFGVGVAVDLRKLIIEIRVAPKAPQFYLEVVEDLAKKYDIDVQVSRSEMARKPRR